MKLIKSPNEYDGSDPVSLFAGGGISNCPDWQYELALLLSDMPGTLVDPRRDDFDVNDPKMEKDQIHWEFRHFGKTTAACFWFPKETLCPITLFELGDQLAIKGKKIFVGCHPQYKRIRDVKIQTALRRPEITVWEGIMPLALDIKNHIRTVYGNGLGK